MTTVRGRKTLDARNLIFHASTSIPLEDERITKRYRKTMGEFSAAAELRIGVAFGLRAQAIPRPTDALLNSLCKETFCRLMTSNIEN